MSQLRTVLLHLDASSQTEHRLRAAHRLAATHGAALEALYAVMPTMMEFPLAFGADGNVATLLAECEAERRDRVKAVFDRECKAFERPGLVWRETRNDPVREFTQQAFASDLLVLGQPDPRLAGSTGVNPDFVASVLIDSGKPGLVLPYVETGPVLGQTILVAWKPTRESARAVTAALPLLQRARQVHLASWAETDADSAAELAPIEAFLRRHDVAVTTHRSGRPSAELGELLLSQGADLQADLLVMGCYGHGRAREWVLGGVTRTILGSMTVPVLMAH